jgi:hypothetical protein
MLMSARKQRRIVTKAPRESRMSEAPAIRSDATACGARQTHADGLGIHGLLPRSEGHDRRNRLSHKGQRLQTNIFLRIFPWCPHSLCLWDRRFRLSFRMTDYRRKLPHIHPAGAYLFITWRLFGSLPAGVAAVRHKSAGDAFVAQDRMLDRPVSGPLWLKEPAIADLVARAILIGDHERNLYRVAAWVVMPNHVHMLNPAPSDSSRIDAVAQGLDGASGKPHPRPDRPGVLAG